MSAEEQLPGLDVPTPAGGQLVEAITRSITAAQLDDRDEGMGQLAIYAARGVELAYGRRDPYAIASTERELAEVLTRLRLTPASRMGADAGGVEKWLAGLQATTD